jgi:UDP-glucose 4-epimerase
MKILIAGGAGFIGSTVSSACLDADLIPVVLDNLHTGRREFTQGLIFFEGDIADESLVNRLFDEHPDIDVTILCAALISVPDSMRAPQVYYEENVVKTLRFVSQIIERGCNRLIFSSTAAVYGTSDTLRVEEDSPLHPESAYARTKAACEGMFYDLSQATSLRVMSLRYFNPIGADPRMRTGLQLPQPAHALGRLITCSELGETFVVAGTDYPTRDGTGMRDYVHVWDLAVAHVAAVQRFDDIMRTSRHEVINLGSGQGTTVRELVAAFNSVVAPPVASVDGPRRPGDVAGGYASREKAERLLGWSPERSITDGVRDSLEWSRRRKLLLGA